MDVNDIMKIIKHNIEKSKNDFEKAKSLLISEIFVSFFISLISKY